MTTNLISKVKASKVILVFSCFYEKRKKERFYRKIGLDFSFFPKRVLHLERRRRAAAPRY